MQYRYVIQKGNYEDYAAGRVLISHPGSAPFPVRLASEIFQRCAAHLSERGSDRPYRVYDPCCGSGYLLAVLGFLHGPDLATILASDIDQEAVNLARRNLSLLTPAGLEERIGQLESFARRFGKESHQEALASAARLKTRLQETNARIDVTCFVADATRLDAAAHPLVEIDMIVTDVPYGRSAQWSGESGDVDAVAQLLDSVRPVLAKAAVVAVVTDKGQKAAHDAYRRIKRLSAGKRHIHLLEPVG